MGKDSKGTILIVDDNSRNLKILGIVLREEGYVPVAAQSGSEALSYVQQDKPDLILLDIMMPHMDGYEVCQKLKKDESTKDIPVIFITAKTETEDLVRAFEVGGVDYVTKPFKSVELLTRVKCQIDLKREILERKLTQEKLKQSEKLELVGILSSGIAHDFNNMLTVIMGNLDLAKQLPENAGRFIEHAEKASGQLAELIEKFLTISDGGWVKKKAVRLPDILEDVAHSSELLRENSYSFSIPDHLNSLHGAQRQLRQLMENLLLNACEATEGMESEKSIHVSADNITIPKDNQWNLKEGDYVKISVIDNGKGIPPELVGKIFDPYFSTKVRSNQKGMGMGLALCYAITKKHGGHINVSANQPKGTRMDVYLPVNSG